jgi:uncharacterized RmlC-like cupin family protein
VDKQTIEAKPGRFVNVPPNILHSFKNETNEVAILIIILPPIGLKQLFVEVGLEVSDINIKPQHLPTNKNKSFLAYYLNMVWK